MIATRLRRFATLSFITTAFLSWAPPGVQAAGDTADWCQRDAKGRYSAEVLPERFSREECNISGWRVFLGGTEIAVPPIGTGYLLEAVELAIPGQDPEGVELFVESHSSGFVVREHVDLGGTPTPSAKSQCSDATRGAGVAYKVKSNFTYRIRTGSVPGNVGASNGVTAINNSYANIIRHANDCSEVRDPNAPTMAYAGSTTVAANFSADGSSCTPDATSVVEWGQLVGSAIGRACVTYSMATGAVTAWDLRLDSTVTWDYTQSDGCFSGNAIDISSVATHEFGHVYGLSHVSESTSPNLTMSTAINGPCQTGERTLGRGDMDHMFAKYGVRPALS